ncbi:MAG: cell division protein [Sphingomonadales bacterium]|nr:cell division protein [Sphingomonadales bacterium]
MPRWLKPKVRFLPSSREGGGLLPWVIAVMMFLCALAIASGLAVFNAAEAWRSDLARNMTIQIVTADSAARDTQLAAALELLRATPGIAAARQVADDELTGLLEPWLGAGNVTDDLPVPAMISVELTPDLTVDIAALGAKLTTVAPDARLDDHQQWIGRLAGLAHGIQIAAAAIVVLIIASTVAIVMFGTRAGLASHRNSIEIMHLMGAEDRVVAEEFQYQFMLHGLKGGLIGILFTVITVSFLMGLAGALVEGLVPELALSLPQAAAIVLMPFFAAALTMITARMTVRAELARMV